MEPPMTAPWTDAEIKFLLMLAPKFSASDIREGLQLAAKTERTEKEIIAKLAELRAEQAA